MTSPSTETANPRHRYLTRMDEMSLADEKAAQTPDSGPDTLEARDDSMDILQGTVSDLRRPLLMAGALAGTALLLAAGLGALIRKVKRAAVRPAL